MSRAACRAGLLVLLAFPAARAAGTPPAPAVRFPALRLAGGGIAAAHQSASGEASDAAAARRRAEILRSPYARLTDRRALRGGEVVLASDQDLAPATREALLRDLPPALAALFDRDGWARPFSARAPLVLEVVSGPAASAAGWDGREKDGSLRSPVAVVSASGRAAGAVLLDALHQVALLSARQAAPDEAAWAAEGVAEYLARRAAGLAGAPVPEDDVLLEEAGSLLVPPVLAAFLDALEAKLPKGAPDVREAWEAAGLPAGDDAEAFVRDVAGRAGARSLGDAIAVTVVSRMASAAARRGAPAASVPRRAWLLAPVSTAAPGPLGWRRASVRTEDERGGVEVALPEAGFRAGRAVLFYRGDAGDFDVLEVLPGETRFLPASGTSGVHVVLADGDGSDVALRLRRAPEYPAALSASGAEWRSGAVEVAWSTAQHRDLLAWVVERREETPGGEGPAALEALPAATESPDATAYLFVDREARAGARYRYRVLALTHDGLLSEAFETRVETR
ncbi:MAG TPA: hypothetical protein VGM13_01970 [Thermoanaerobaculia bacterium]|jgi:hypothetical protein